MCRGPHERKAAVQGHAEYHRGDRRAGIHVLKRETDDKRREDRHAEHTVKLLDEVDDAVRPGVDGHQQQRDNHKHQCNDRIQARHVWRAADIFFVEVADVERRRRVQDTVHTGQHRGRDGGGESARQPGRQNIADDAPVGGVTDITVQFVGHNARYYDHGRHQ